MTQESSIKTHTRIIKIYPANPTLSWSQGEKRGWFWNASCWISTQSSHTLRAPGPPLKAWPSKCLKCNTKQSIERQVMCRTKGGFSTSVTQWERDEWLLAPLRALTDHLKAASFDCDSVIVSQIQSRWALTWGRGNWTFIKVRDCLQAAL